MFPLRAVRDDGRRSKMRKTHCAFFSHTKMTLALLFLLNAPFLVSSSKTNKLFRSFERPVLLGNCLLTFSSLSRHCDSHPLLLVGSPSHSPSSSLRYTTRPRGRRRNETFIFSICIIPRRKKRGGALFHRATGRNFSLILSADNASQSLHPFI